MAVRLRRVAGWSGLLLAAALGAAIAVMAVVLATRPGLRKVIDLSPAKRFTITDDTIELLDELRKAGHTLELHTVYEPLGLPENATERDRYIYALRSSLQDLTTDLLRQYAAHGGEAVKVVHHDLRLHIDRVRELTRALDQRMANFVLVKVDQRNKVLSVDFDLAQIDFGQSQATRLPGQSREPKPILQDYKGEEAISSAIKSLLVEGRPKLYVLEGYREADISSSTSVSYSSLMHALEREGFQIARLNLTESRVVPDDAACVALFEPGSEMPDAHADALVDYLRKGGRMFLGVVYVHAPMSWNPTFANLGQRLGFELGEDLVCHLVHDPARPDRPGRDGTEFVEVLPVASLNPVHPVTRPLVRAGRFPTVRLAREIRRAAQLPDGIAFDPSLMRSGRYAWIEHRTVRGEGGEPVVDWIAPRDVAPEQLFASRCVGAVIDVASSVEGRPGHLVIVSGHAFNNHVFETVNGDLALNIFQWMAERKALVGVRGTRYQPRELKLVGQQVERVQWLLIGGVPISLFVLGALVQWRRSRI